MTIIKSHKKMSRAIPLIVVLSIATPSRANHDTESLLIGAFMTVSLAVTGKIVTGFYRSFKDNREYANRIVPHYKEVFDLDDPTSLFSNDPEKMSAFVENLNADISIVEKQRQNDNTVQELHDQIIAFKKKADRALNTLYFEKYTTDALIQKLLASQDDAILEQIAEAQAPELENTPYLVRFKNKLDHALEVTFKEITYLLEDGIVIDGTDARLFYDRLNVILSQITASQEYKDHLRIVASFKRMDTSSQIHTFARPWDPMYHNHLFNHHQLGVPNSNMLSFLENRQRTMRKNETPSGSFNDDLFWLVQI